LLLGEAGERELAADFTTDLMQKKNDASFEELIAAAIEHHNAGRLVEAERFYNAALEICPGHPAIAHNLGVLFASQNDHAAAIEKFDASIAAEPRYASAHYNRAVVMEALGRSEDAIRGFSRTVALEPEHYASHRALGFLWLAKGERGRSLDHFARTHELRRGEDRTGIASRSLESATKSKLLHDAEQFRYLSRDERSARRFTVLANSYERVGRNFPDAMTMLTDADFEALGDDYNTAIHVAMAPEIPDGAVYKRNDANEIMRQFGEGGAGIAYFDDLLTSRALSALKRYLLESTIWHDFTHIGDFVASYLEDGLACPLVLQIADELRAAFPQVLGPCPLSQAWAFKGLEGHSKVEAHADDGAVSVNFWVTPTAANLTPGRGGLVVCKARPPSDWVMRDYEGDQGPIGAFLKQNSADSIVVPYRENRAALFESRLFHYSDAPTFAGGYENHRINVTMLFGKAV
jgi:tetratricopeptide (TPR) repeat protein